MAGQAKRDPATKRARPYARGIHETLVAKGPVALPRDGSGGPLKGSAMTDIFLAPPEPDAVALGAAMTCPNLLLALRCGSAASAEAWELW